MKIGIEFNAAFTDSPHGETSRLVREVAERIAEGHADGALHDINDRYVGSWAIIPEPWIETTGANLMRDAARQNMDRRTS